MLELTDDEKAILDFEAQQWTYPGAKETAIVQEFDMLAPRYYQVLNRLLDRPAALAYAPLLARRLLRLRDARARQRGGVGQLMGQPEARSHPIGPGESSSWMGHNRL